MEWIKYLRWLFVCLCECRIGEGPVTKYRGVTEGGRLVGLGSEFGLVWFGLVWFWVVLNLYKMAGSVEKEQLQKQVIGTIEEEKLQKQDSENSNNITRTQLESGEGEREMAPTPANSMHRSGSRPQLDVSKAEIQGNEEEKYPTILLPNQSDDLSHLALDIGGICIYNSCCLLELIHSDAIYLVFFCCWSFIMYT